MFPRSWLWKPYSNPMRNRSQMKKRTPGHTLVKVSFESELEAGLTVRGDREFLAQALANLLDNAVKYTPPGGAIMLRVRRKGSDVVMMLVAGAVLVVLAIVVPDQPGG